MRYFGSAQRFPLRRNFLAFSLHQLCFFLCAIGSTYSLHQLCFFSMQSASLTILNTSQMASHAKTMPFSFHSKLFIQYDYSNFNKYEHTTCSVMSDHWSVVLRVLLYFRKHHEIIVGDNWPQFHFRINSNFQFEKFYFHPKLYRY